MDKDMEHTHEELCAILNGQTGKLAWPELERHFARGMVVRVDNDLDLVEVAAAVVEDNKEAVNAWMASSQVMHADERDAKDWTLRQPQFWAVVAAPWVLIQEIV
jgi:hypothetical protein